MIGPLDHRQHAFGRCSSCNTALLGVVTHIEHYIFWGEYDVVGAFVYIAGALDNLSLAATVVAMKKHGIINWNFDYLPNRTAKTSIWGTTVEVEIVGGTPQGCVLNPPLWNISSDSLLHLMKRVEWRLLDLLTICPSWLEEAVLAKAAGMGL